MKHTLLLLCILTAAGILFAGTDLHPGAGNYGYKFLNVPPGPISIALGGGGIHSEANPFAYLEHPAAACEANQRILGVSMSPWLADTQANTIAYSYARRSSHFGIAIRNLDYGDVENRDDTGFLIGYYNPVDLSVVANYAYRIGPSTYVGMNLGTLYQKLDTATSLGLYADFGFSIIPPLKDSKLSASIRNIGNATYTNQEKVRFPTSMRADFTKGFALGEQKLSLGLNGIKGMDEDIKGSIYSELELLDILRLRGAYKLNYAAETFAAGFGIAYKRFSVDYGFGAFDSGLNDVHSFGLSYQF
ncbi:MAG: hypothetical protein KA984_00165 [Candidatus Cloacimonetes bacterium]|nr:hypothetical protein [Candidatus Cloacimonadota bacterium]